MAEDIQVQVEADAVLRRFALLPDEQKAAVRRGLARGLLRMESDVRRGTGLKARRGAAGLMGRLTSGVVQGDKFEIDGVIGFRKTRGFPYEMAQEFGAKAKPGKAMAVPVSAEARNLSNRGQGPLSFPRKLFIPAGSHVLAEKTGARRGRPLITHYVLMKSLPPRLKFRETVEGDVPMVLAEIVKEVRKVKGIAA